MRMKRATMTLRILRGADHGAKIHDRLVEGVWATFWNEGFGDLPKKTFGFNPFQIT
jgi:hypothetical protein